MQNPFVLNGLDDIDWAELTHAYGTAENVPDLIRGLRSSDADMRRESVFELYGNIFHQGSRYEASAQAVPFLLELMADPATPDRPQIIHLLASLAIGYGYSFVTTGFPIAELRYATSQVHQRTRQLWLEQVKNWHKGFADDGRPTQPFPLSKVQRHALEACHEVEAYDAVGKGLPQLVDLLDDDDDSLVSQAIYAMAWFPEQARIVLPGLGRIATDDQQPREVISSALVAIGLVAPAGTRDFDKLLGTHLAGDEPHLKWSAAIALARIAGSSVPEAALAELGAWAANYGDASPATIWEISRPDLAMKMLDAVDTPTATGIRTTLVAGELARAPKSNWHNHFNVVLDRAFPSMDEHHGLTFAELTAPQQAVVIWLTQNPHVFGSSGPEHPLKQHGLPTTLEALKTYAGRTAP